MLTKTQIERFYTDVEGLGLKFPVAAIADATGENKANVSKYLGKKLEPSEGFLKRFYEKFPKGGNNGVDGGDEWKDKYIRLLEKNLSEANSEQVAKLVKQNQALLMTLQTGLARLISKAEKKEVREVAHELRKETISNLESVGIL